MSKACIPLRKFSYGGQCFVVESLRYTVEDVDNRGTIGSNVAEVQAQEYVKLTLLFKNV